MPLPLRLWRAPHRRARRAPALAAGAVVCALLASGAALGGCTGEAPEAAAIAKPPPKKELPRTDDGPPGWEDSGDAAEAPDGGGAPTSPPAPAAAPEASGEPAEAAPAPEPTATDRDDHVDFALDFLGRQGFNSVPGFVDLYAPEVRYYDRGTLSREEVAEDKAAYFERWPNRYFELSGPVRATPGEAPTLRFDYVYAVSHADLSGEREGRAWVELGLTPTPTGFAITSERGGTYG